MNESCWEGYKQVGMKKKGNRTVPNCVKKNKFSFAEWLNESDEQYQGDSNPMGNTWVDTWHEAQKHAFSGNTQLAVSMMKKAAQQARQESPGEAKYYLGTAAWLSGDKAKCLAMTKDSDVVQTGNDKVLLRLLNSKTSNYQQAYSQNEHVAEWLNENYPEEGDSKYSSLTFNIKRRKLNVPELIKRGAIFVTYAHDEDGWEADPDNQNHMSDWSHSLITLYNVELGKKNGGWTAEAPEYIKPKSYSHAERSINSSAPNLGNNQLVYDGKYNQILWSIEKLKIPENIAFMESNHDY